MQSKLPIKDILARNHHHNLFKLKIPSHNASKQSVENMYHGFILNKLALIPFEEDPKMVQLFRTSLEHLLQLPLDYYKNEEFVEELTEYLCIWEKHMNQFGTWPYTRTAFYSIEEKVKKNQTLWERVICKRALLEPNKQQFLNKVFNQTFKNQRLIKLISMFEGKQSQAMVEEPKCQLPRDILLEDAEECWKQLQLKYEQLDRDQVNDYLNQYANQGVSKFVKRKLMDQQQSILQGLALRQTVFQKIKGSKSETITQWIESISSKRRINY